MAMVCESSDPFWDETTEDEDEYEGDPTDKPGGKAVLRANQVLTGSQDATEENFSRDFVTQSMSSPLPHRFRRRSKAEDPIIADTTIDLTTLQAPISPPLLRRHGLPGELVSHDSFTAPDTHPDSFNAQGSDFLDEELFAASEFPSQLELRQQYQSELSDLVAQLQQIPAKRKRLEDHERYMTEKQLMDAAFLINMHERVCQRLHVWTEKALDKLEEEIAQDVVINL